MTKKLEDKLLYIFLIFFFITPFLTTIQYALTSRNYIIWYLPNAIMMSLGIITLINMFTGTVKYKKKDIYLTIILILTLFLSCLFSYEKIDAFIGDQYRAEGFLTWISYIGFMYCGFRMNEKNKNVKIMNIIILSATLMSIILITKSPIAYKVSNILENEYYFYTGPFAHYNHMGYYLLIACIVNLFMIFNSKGKAKLVYILTNIVLLYTFVINDTFGAFLGYLAVLITLLIRYLKKKEKILESILIISTFVLICIFTNRNGINIVERNFSGLFNDTVTIVDITTNSDSKVTQKEIYDVGTNRGKLWIYAFKFFLREPIFGYGPENLQYEYMKYEIYDQKPHNMILELLTNSGIIFTVAYIVFLVRIAVKVLPLHKKMDWYELMHLSIIIAFIINWMFGNSTFCISPYFYLSLGFVAKRYYEKI